MKSGDDVDVIAVREMCGILLDSVWVGGGRGLGTEKGTTHECQRGMSEISHILGEHAAAVGEYDEKHGRGEDDKKHEHDDQVDDMDGDDVKGGNDLIGLRDIAIDAVREIVLNKALTTPGTDSMDENKRRRKPTKMKMLRKKTMNSKTCRKVMPKIACI